MPGGRRRGGWPETEAQLASMGSMDCQCSAQSSEQCPMCRALPSEHVSSVSVVVGVGSWQWQYTEWGSEYFVVSSGFTKSPVCCHFATSQFFGGMRTKS